MHRIDCYLEKFYGGAFKGLWMIDVNKFHLLRNILNNQITRNVIQKNDMWPSKKNKIHLPVDMILSISFVKTQQLVVQHHSLTKQSVIHDIRSDHSLTELDILMNCLPVKFFDQTIGYLVRVSDMWHPEAWYGGPTPHICLSSSNERKNLQICLFFYIFFKNKNNMWHLEAWSAQSHTSVSLHPMKEKMSDCFFFIFVLFFFK